MKKIRTINIDEKIWKEFQLQSVILSKSVSSRLEEYMKQCVEKKEGK